MKRNVASSTQFGTPRLKSNRSGLQLAPAKQANVATPTFAIDARQNKATIGASSRRQALFQTAQAFLLYLALAILFFGRSMIGHWSSYFLGTGTDPSQAMWLLTWWPYALWHHLNPFITDFVWAPVSFNFAWMTSIPVPALLASPLTETIGSVATYNVLAMLAIPLASTGTYALCRRIVRRHWPSVMGGLVFGFSSYMIAQQLGHMCLTMTFAAPLASYLVVRRLEGSLGEKSFVVLLTLTMVCQFGIDLELFATIILVGAIAILAGYLSSGEMSRKRLRSLIGLVVIAFAATGLIVSPYLYYFFAYPGLKQPFWPSDKYSIDLLNLFVPTQLNFLGSLPVLVATSSKFTGSLIEQSGYIALPLILIAIVWAARHRREPLCKVLMIPLAAVLLMALGPFLQVGGKWVALMPWLILGRLPLLEHALPSRLMVFPPLILAVISAMWLTDPATRRETKAIAVALTIVLMMPNPARLWATRIDTPKFFTEGIYRNYLSPKDVVMTLPWGEKGSSMLWQADCGMCFRNVGGWTGVQRFSVRRWPIVGYFLGAPDLSDKETQLKAFVANTGVTAVIVDDAQPEAKRWNTLVSTLGVKPVTVAGMSLYKISPNLLLDYQAVSGLTMEERALQQRFTEVITAADRYMTTGRRPAKISEDSLIDQSELPSDWRPSPLFADMHLRPWGNGGVAIELLGSPSALQVISDRYREEASEVYLPFPLILDGTIDRSSFKTALNHLLLPRPAMPVDGESLRVLRLNFSREQLHQVALWSANYSPSVLPGQILQ